jgi:hypothetical protein
LQEENISVLSSSDAKVNDLGMEEEQHLPPDLLARQLGFNTANRIPRGF